MLKKRGEGGRESKSKRGGGETTEDEERSKRGLREE